MRLEIKRIIFVFISLLLTTMLSANQPICAKRGKHKITKNAIKEYGKEARKILAPYFKRAKVDYPPKSLTFIGLKEEKLLHIFAKNKKGKNVLIRTYPIIDASGTSGPKLKEGDKQVPEGIYRVIGFKPNSIAHLALLINYPNSDDKRFARLDKRTDLGCDIEIHGSYWSTGCLAMGDPAIEEIFVLAYDTGCRAIKVIFAPCNMNVKEPDIDMKKQPKWLPGLYQKVKGELSDYSIVSEVLRSKKFDARTLVY